MPHEGLVHSLCTLRGLIPDLTVSQAQHEMSSPPPRPRLQYFPVSFFAVVMGLTGLSVAWHKAEQVFSLNLAVSGAFLGLASVAFLALVVVYLLFRAAKAVGSGKICVPAI